MVLYYPPYPIFDSSYDQVDKNLICTVLYKVCFTVYNQLRPHIGAEKAEAMMKDLRIEFVSEKNEELKRAGAIGLAYRDRNLNVFPAGIGERHKRNEFFARMEVAVWSAVMAMELTHSIIWRLTGSLKICNDIIHWLYNENYVKTIEYVSQWNLKYFGGHLKVVFPQTDYGWINKDKIMDGIKSGLYQEGRHAYFSDPAWKGEEPEYIAATEHELDDIRKYVVYGGKNHHH